MFSPSYKKFEPSVAQGSRCGVSRLPVGHLVHNRQAPAHGQNLVDERSEVVNTGATDDHFQVASERSIDRMNGVRLLIRDATDHKHDDLLRPGIQFESEKLLRVSEARSCKYAPVSRDVGASERVAGLFELSFDQLLVQLLDQWSVLSVNVVDAFEAFQDSLGDGYRVLVVKQICFPEPASSVRTYPRQILQVSKIRAKLIASHSKPS